MAGYEGPPRSERRRRFRDNRQGWPGAWLLEAVRDLLRRHGRTIRTLLIYVGSLAGLLFLYSQLDGTWALDRILRFNAEATGLLAGLFGADVQVSGSLVMADSLALLMVQECAPLAPMAIFAAAVVAYPAPLSGKLWGLLWGAVVLTAVNLVRTTSLFYIGLNFPGALEVAHLLVWQSIMVVLSVVLWLLWMRRYAYHGSS